MMIIKGIKYIIYRVHYPCDEIIIEARTKKSLRKIFENLSTTEE